MLKNKSPSFFYKERKKLRGDLTVSLSSELKRQGESIRNTHLGRDRQNDQSRLYFALYFTDCVIRQIRAQKILLVSKLNIHQKLNLSKDESDAK